MTDRIATQSAVPGGARVLTTMPPRWVFASFNPIAKVLMAAGVPLGFNGLITVRGRKSGLPPYHARGDHRGRWQALGVVPVGRRAMGAQSARRWPRHDHGAPP
jgi:hypothetical protein